MRWMPLLSALLACDPLPDEVGDTATDFEGDVQLTSWLGFGADMGSTSDGEVPITCPTNALASGFGCTGSYCDNLSLRCEYTLGHRDSTRYWQPWFSEESPRRQCTGTSWVAGFACKGSYCDDISLECVFTGRAPHDCAWSGWYSEESAAVFRAPTGTFLHGMECRGRYCDDVRAEYCFD